MSHVAIAAALALEDVAGGERLAAFSLASFANREQRAWPGTGVAAARAGLSRSQYLAARDGLRRRGLIEIEEPGGGRGNSPTVVLLFAERGPRFEGYVNASLFDATLGYSRSRGSARLLLATLAALANDDLEVVGLATEEIRAAAGMADSTYRRACTALLAGGELVLEVAGGGRGKTNRWQLRDPCSGSATPVTASRGRVGPRAGDRPLIAAAKGPRSSGVSGRNPAQHRTVAAENGPGSSGVCTRNPAQDRTLSAGNPAGNPATNPAAQRARGKGTRNLRTIDPPSPPGGGSRTDSVTIIEEYVNERGRRRQRPVTVELDAIREQFHEPAGADRAAWLKVRSELSRVVGESMFEIWLAPLELIAVDRDDCLLIAAPPATRSWVAERFGRLLDRVGSASGQQLRLARVQELQLLEALAAAAPALPRLPHPQLNKEAM